MQIVVDVIPDGGKTIYESTVGELVNIAMPKGRSSKKCKNGRVLVPIYNITPELLRSAAETLEYAKKQGKWSACLLVKGEKMGLVCV